MTTNWVSFFYTAAMVVLFATGGALVAKRFGVPWEAGALLGFSAGIYLAIVLVLKVRHERQGNTPAHQ